ncbi:MAG: bis-aminopropyl spermidine synthase family protein [Dehalococcoidia bacterium]
MDRFEAESTLYKVSLDSQLQEGYQGVRLILREILRKNPVPIRAISRLTGIPVPAVSAARRELEKRKLLSRSGGASLTEAGLELLSAIGINDQDIPDFRPPYSISDLIQEQITKFDELSEDRPDPDYKLDQSHAISTTCFRRVMYFHENDAIEGRDIAILGDDDLTSLAIMIFSIRHGLKVNSLNVFDIDQRILTFVESISQTLGFEVNLYQIDLIEKLQDSYQNNYDVIISDPPYTVEGLTRFAGVGAEMVKENVGGIVFLSYPNLPPADNALFFRNIVNFGFSPQELIPGFNEYVGAQIHAGKSNMGRFFVSGLDISFRDMSSDRIYTSQRNP